jgi:hypothetical protein
MKRRHHLILGLEILALASFLWHRLIFDPWSKAGRPLALAWMALAGIILVTAGAMIKGVNFYARVVASKTAAVPSELRRSLVLSLAPLLFLSLTFLQSFVFLNDINFALILVSAAGFLALQAVLLTRVEWLPSNRTLPDQFRVRLDSEKTSGRRLPLAVFLITLTVYGVYNAGLIVPAQPLTGDEPHYVLVARSILADGDINLYNDYLDRNYEAYYHGRLEPHAFPGRNGERSLYSKHFPGLPLLIVPFYAAGERAGDFLSRLSGRAVERKDVLVFFIRLPVCLLAALLGLCFFLSARELVKKNTVALAAWLVFSFTAPLIFYSHLIYPEIPTALILIWIMLALALKKRLSTRNLFRAGLGIGLLPWFALKYLPLALTAFVIVLILLLQPGRRSLRGAAAFLSPVVVSAGLFIFFLWSVFGSLSPAHIYLGASEAKNFSYTRILSADVVEFGTRFLGLLFDQRGGFMVFAPFYVLGLAGFLALRKSRPKESAVLFSFLAVFWLFSSVTPYWGGYCPPGRPLLPVFWVIGLFLAWAFTLSPPRAGRIFGLALIAATLALTFLAVQNPRTLYHEGLSSLSFDLGGEMSSKFLAGLSNIAVDWTRLVPSLSARAAELRNWVPLAFWIPAALGINLLWLRRRRAQGRNGREHGRLALFPDVALVIILGGLVTAYRFFDVRLRDGFRLDDGKIAAFAQDQNSFGEEGGGFWVRGSSRAFLLVQTPGPVAEFQMTLSSPVEGETKIRFGTGQQRIRRNIPAGPPEKATFSSPRGIRWKEGYLYSLEVEESGGFFPYQVDQNSKDQRHLGVFVRLSARFR